MRLPIRTVLMLCFFAALMSGCASQSEARSKRASASSLPVSEFQEIWGYLVAGREAALTSDLPITDIGYFGAEIDTYGKLTSVPNIRNLANFRGRKHLVVGSGGRALTYFVLKEGSAERRELIRDLIQAAAPYDGLQINFENVPARSAEAYHSFLRELRQSLRGKILSVAIAARTAALQNDAYDYAKVAPLVDKFLVMAYDEHWSGSAHGPIASMAWSERVARYALSIAGAEKLVMGLPFYGRSWANVNMNRAHIHDGIETIIKDHGIESIRREFSIPTFKFDMPITVTVYYEDAQSLTTRLQMYRSMGVRSVGFWRLGQETKDFWSFIGVEGGNP